MPQSRSSRSQLVTLRAVPLPTQNQIARATLDYGCEALVAILRRRDLDLPEQMTELRALVSAMGRATTRLASVERALIAPRVAIVDDLFTHVEVLVAGETASTSDREATMRGLGHLSSGVNELRDALRALG